MRTPTPFDKLRSDELRADLLFKLAVGRAPESGRDPCSQSTMSRLENAPSRTEVGRMTAALVDVFCRSFPIPPAAITLDIDDTCDAVHGHQQLSLFNAHYRVGAAAGDESSVMGHCMDATRDVRTDFGVMGRQADRSFVSGAPLRHHVRGALVKGGMAARGGTLE